MRHLSLAVLILALGCPGTSLPDFDGDGVADDVDCAPEDPDVFSSQVDPPGDGRDLNCDGHDGEDADGDGYAGNLPPEADGRDCDDANAAVHPGATELEDGIDNDCDGFTDEGSPSVDDDGDGFCEAPIACRGDGVQPGDCDDSDPVAHPGDADADGVDTCAALPDCDDADPARTPGASEACDGVDNDCDGTVPPAELDLDGDGARPCAGDCDDTDAAAHPDDGDGDGQSPCAGDCDDADPTVTGTDGDGDGSSTCAGDCDDHDAARSPIAPEVCNGVDDDCDGSVPAAEIDGDSDGDPACSDCDDDDASLHTLDGDGDGVSTCAGDCDDGDASVSPVAIDALDPLGIDANCDGVDGVDNDGDGAPQGLDCDDSDATLHLDDADGDGQSPCAGDCDDADPSLDDADVDADGFSTCDGDCDDGAWPLNPGQPEVCDLLDNNCDGVQTDEVDLDGDTDPACSDCDDDNVSLHSLDADGDSVSLCDSPADCDDDQFLFRPFALDPFGDGFDTNCDGGDGVDGDGDGFASLASGGPDCDDGDAGVRPGALEVVGDGIDQDCDGLDVVDLDGDGYGAVVAGGTDCDDDNATIHPGQLDPVGDGVDLNCDGVDGLVAHSVTGGPSNTGVGDLFVATSADCDLTGDGQADLVLVEAGSTLTTQGFGQRSSILAGPIDGSRSIASAAATILAAETSGAFFPSPLCPGDLDADGLADLVVDTSRDLLGYSGPLDGAMLEWSASEHRDRGSYPYGALAKLAVGDFDGTGSPGLLRCRSEVQGFATACELIEAPLCLPWSTAVTSEVLTVDTYLTGLQALDWDGDGFDDIAIGSQSPTAAPIAVFTQPFTGRDASNANVSLLGEAGWEYVGIDIQAIDDATGDGRDDLVVAVGCTDCAAPVGSVFVVPGGSAGVGSVASMAVARIDAPGGVAAACGGDFDGDGHLDVALLEAGDFLSQAPVDAGLYVLRGPLAGTTVASPADRVWVRPTGEFGSLFGAEVLDCTADLDGGGRADFVITDTGADQAWVIPNPFDAACTLADSDGDGWSSCGGDCDDADPTLAPGRLDPFGDRVDSDCDGADGVDADGDGYGSAASGGPDCDDGDETSFPGAAFVLGDGIDQDCDGADELDADGDGQLAGVTDCDDGVASIRTGAPELCEDGVDQNCDGIDALCPQPTRDVSVGAATITNAGGHQGWGGTLSWVGDLDGDGFDELVVGAPTAEVGGNPNAGQAFLFYGPINGALTDGDADATIGHSRGGAYLATGVIGGRDVDGDDLDDLVITERFGANSNLGAAALVFLTAPQGALDEKDADAELRLLPGESMGEDLRWLQDVTGDGHPEVVARVGDGTSAEGQLVALSLPLSGTSTRSGSEPTWPGSSEGWTVGDWNADGWEDLAIARPDAAVVSPGEGVVLVFAGPLDGDLSIFVADQVLRGGGDQWALGVSAASGDLDGDGVPELLLGAGVEPSQGLASTWEGRFFVAPAFVPGAVNLAVSASSTWTGTTSQMGAGQGVVALGDVDGDGFGDVALAVTNPLGGTDYEGGVAILHGPVFGDRLLHEADLRLLTHSVAHGGAPNLAGGGDHDGDGAGDLAILDQGVVYVVDGSSL